MSTTAFYQSYIDLACGMLAISRKPAEMEQERRRLKQESREYVDYLEKFEPFFETYPAFKTELFANLSSFRVGAFIEYQLDLFYAELKRVGSLKAEIQQEFSELRNDFFDETKEWLPEEEHDINGCFHYLDTVNIQQAIGFLTDRLTKLKVRKESCLLEKQRELYAAKEGERQVEEAKRQQSMEDARKRGITLTQQEIEEKRKKAQDAYKKQMIRRKK